MGVGRLLTAAACCLFASLPLGAQELPFIAPAPEEQLPELETVVVYGGLATPQMWKVSKDDHVLWLLGDAPAPAGSQWRFDQVEARLAESRLVMYPGRVDVDVGFFRVVGLLTMARSAYMAITRNPDGKTLEDVLPPEVYERWRALKTAFAPRDKDLEKARPSRAMEILEEMIEKSLRPQPGDNPVVQDVSAQPKPPPPRPSLRPLVDKAAKKHRVRIRTAPGVEQKVQIRNAREMFRFVGAFDQVDVACVTQRLEYLERKVEYLKQIAAGTAQEGAPARVPHCDEMDLLMSKLMSGEIADTAGILALRENAQRQRELSNQRLNEEWIAAAQAALAKNKSTFAVLPLGQLTSPTGQLAKLRELGYEVEEP